MLPKPTLLDLVPRPLPLAAAAPAPPPLGPPPAPPPLPRPLPAPWAGGRYTTFLLRYEWLIKSYYS